MRALPNQSEEDLIITDHSEKNLTLPDQSKHNLVFPDQSEQKNTTNSLDHSLE